ncbi:MAG: hypothetical protein AB7Q37_02300 [Pyrinomonadaceae bacterium]
MRTTLDIDEDILQAAKELSRRRGRTAGSVISELARRGLTNTGSKTKEPAETRNGVPVLPSRGEIVTLEHVANLMDKEGI